MFPLLFLFGFSLFSVLSQNPQDCIPYSTSEQEWTNIFRHQAYSYYLKAIERRNFNYAVYKDKLGRTTPLPTLSVLFFEKDRLINPKNNYVSLSEVLGKPRTVDDDIGMPLNQPINNHKVSFHRYYPYYNPYYPV